MFCGPCWSGGPVGLVGPWVWWAHGSGGFCWLSIAKSPTLRGPTCQGVLGLVFNRFPGTSIRHQYMPVKRAECFPFRDFKWGHEKSQKNDFSQRTLISQNLLKEANIQARSMWNLTSWRFRKCGTYWACHVFNGSYRPSKMDESEKNGPSPKISGVKKINSQSLEDTQVGYTSH
jgi:hypothetical protein